MQVELGGVDMSSSVCMWILILVRHVNWSLMNRSISDTSEGLGRLGTSPHVPAGGYSI